MLKRMLSIGPVTSIFYSLVSNVVSHPKGKKVFENRVLGRIFGPKREGK
jgi:hypothetical protein